MDDRRARYELFVQLDASQPEQVRMESFVAMPAIVEAGDYALAERYLKNPLQRLDELNGLAGSLALFPTSGAPRLAAELDNFIKDVRHLAAVHEGLGRAAEATALRAAALTGLKSDELRDWAARELARPGAIRKELSWRQMGLTVRYTSEDDWQQLKRVRLAALKEAPTAFAVSHATASGYTDDQWRERAAGKGAARFLLAYVEGQPFGMVAHMPATAKAAATELNLIAMWVTPDLRGAPVATKLVEAVKAHAIEHGYTRVLLDVAPDNLRAVNFYQKLGFSFLPEWEPLESHPHIQLQKMVWQAAV